VTVRDGVQIVWEDAGEGEPVLLIHGLGYDRAGWGPALGILADRFRVVSFDNRGVGESDAPPGPYSTAEMAADARAVLDDAGVEQAHVVGTSLGGMIAQEFASRFPERVASLVLNATTPAGVAAFAMPQRSVERFAAFAEDPSLENLRGLVENSLSEWTVTSRPQLVEQIFRYRVDHLPRLEPWLAQAAAGRTFSLQAALPAPRTSTLVIQGIDDNVVDYRNAELLTQAIPGAELVLVPRMGHLGFWERPHDFAVTVAAFFDRCTAGVPTSGQ
jgi:3-oxoadipate enol-lactonase